jgi:hypothetical protein
MDSELMTTALLDEVRHLGRELEAHRRDKERRGNAVLVQQLDNTTQPLP